LVNYAILLLFPIMAMAEIDCSLTELLQRYSGGDLEVADALFREILPTLHQLAVRQLARERYAAPVSATALVNELWLRNLRHGGWSIRNRDHFYAIVGVALRRVCVDLARTRLALVRGGGEIPASLEDGWAVSLHTTDDLEQIVEIGELMDRLEKKDPVGARIVDMRYFAGYTIEEIAENTGLDIRHVRYRYKKAEDWLKDHMRD